MTSSYDPSSKHDSQTLKCLFKNIPLIINLGHITGHITAYIIYPLFLIPLIIFSRPPFKNSKKNRKCVGCWFHLPFHFEIISCHVILVYHVTIHFGFHFHSYCKVIFHSDYFFGFSLWPLQRFFFLIFALAHSPRLYLDRFHSAPRLR